MQSRFFHPSPAAEAIRHICLARYESPIAKEQRIPSESPGERELRVVQEPGPWHPIPLGANRSSSVSKAAAHFGTRQKNIVLLLGLLKIGKGSLNLTLLHRFPCQESTQEGQPVRELMTIQVEHSQSPIMGTLITDLYADHRFSTSSQQHGEGLWQCPPMVLG